MQARLGAAHDLRTLRIRHRRQAAWRDRAYPIGIAGAGIDRFAVDLKYPDLRTFFEALQAIVSGTLDRPFADAPDVHPTMAAEILYLIETLEKRR